MSNIPAPVDLNRLKNILGGAKAVMNKAQANSPVVPNKSAQAPVNENRGGQGGEVEYLTELPAHMQQGQQQAEYVPHKIDGQGRGHYVNESNSKLPPNVLAAMINNPMPQVSLETANHTFSLEDVQDLIEDKQPAQQPAQIMYENQQPVQQPVPQPLKQAQKGDMITVSESILRGIMKEELMKFMTTTFTQQLKEETIKKTIQTLIKEGKLKTKTKKINS